MGHPGRCPNCPHLSQVEKVGCRIRSNGIASGDLAVPPLLALVGGTTSLAAASTHAALAGQSLAMELSRSATGQLERGRQRQPVVILRPGYRFIVYVSEDLAFDAPYLP